MSKSVDLGNYRELEKILKNVSGEFYKISNVLDKAMHSPIGKIGALLAGTGYAIGSGLRMTGSYMQYAGQERQVAIDYALNRASSVFQEQQARMQMLYSGNAAGIRDLMQYGPQARTIAERRFEAREEQLKGRTLQTAGGLSDISLSGAMMGGGMKMGAAGGAAGLAFEGVVAIPAAIAGFVTGTVIDIMKQVQTSAQNTGLAKQQLDEFKKSKDIFIETQIRELSTSLAQMSNPYLRAMEDVYQPRIQQDYQNIQSMGMSAGEYFTGRRNAVESNVSPQQYLTLRQNLMNQGFTGRTQGTISDLTNQAMDRNALAGTYEQRAAYISAARMYGGAESQTNMSANGDMTTAMYAKNKGVGRENGMGVVSNRYYDAGTQLAMQQADIQQLQANSTFTKGSLPFAQGITDAMREGGINAGLSEDQANLLTKSMAGNVPGLTQRGGTIENQVMRAGIRGALRKGGLTGASLVYAEQYFQGKSLEEIQAMLADESTVKKIFGLSSKGARELRKAFTETNLQVLRAEGIDKSTIAKIRKGGTGKNQLTSKELFQISQRMPGMNDKSPAEAVMAASGLVAEMTGRTGKAEISDRQKDEATQSVEYAAKAMNIGKGSEEMDILKFMETEGGRVKTGVDLMQRYKSLTPEEHSKFLAMSKREKDNLTNPNGPQTDVDKAMSHFVTVLNGAAASIESAFKTHGMSVGGAR
jgi:hypothetical protein